MSLLSVERLSVTVPALDGPARAVRDVSFDLAPGGSLGLVGESGCGKSMTALAIMGLLPEGARASGRVVFEGRDLLGLPDRAMQRVRGARIAMIFQEPMTSLNPVHRIGRQIAEVLVIHGRADRTGARGEAERLLDRVGIADPRRRLDHYPHQLSGGQRQRVMIAIALACQPALLIADEPTTALDLSTQKQILDLVRDLARDLGMALLLISHDLGVIANTVARIAVMYGGAVVESGPTASIFASLSHPYTQGLFAAIPRLSRQGIAAARAGRLQTIPGTVPDLPDLPPGCTFADRCPIAVDACRTTVPPDVAVAAEHSAACLRIDVAQARRASPR